MSEFRQNHATREWVLIAPERAARPHDASLHLIPRAPVAQRDDCPFCPGNEDRTGAELWRAGPLASDSVSGTATVQHAWSVRVVENSFPALTPDTKMQRVPVGMFLKATSHGRAEVVIESPVHSDRWPTYSTEQIVTILHAYRDRSLDIALMPEIAIVMLFKNHGATAGTSLEHPHSQIIASPIIPPHIRDPIQKAAAHYDTHGTCVYCDIIAEELRQRERVFAENASFVAFCPFASRSPYEMRIYPKRHTASFGWILDDEVEALASILRTLFHRMNAVLGDVDYNFIIRSSPIGDEDVRHLHWYFVLIPKLGHPAGFEIGSGIFINTSTPEACASILREAG